MPNLDRRTPIRPGELKPFGPVARDEIIGDLVQYVNLILGSNSNIAVLLAGSSVLIGDKSLSVGWLTFHKEVMEQFRNVGWRVTLAESLGFYNVYFPTEATDVD